MFSYGWLLVARNLLVATVLTMLPINGAQAEESFTVLAFGDSLTRGYGLPEEQGLVPQLQLWLNANGGENIKVLNAGLNGDTTAGGLARIEWTLTEDVDAVIVALGGNDMLRGISPASSQGNLDNIVALLTQRGLPVMLVGLPGPSNFGPEFKAEFDAMYPVVANKYDVQLYPYFFEGFDVAQDTASIAKWMQADGNHPNAAGVLLIAANMGPAVLQLVAE
jgi:acyl-CoA thioesterase-1